MKKRLMLSLSLSAGIGVILTVISFSERAMTQNQPSNSPDEEHLERARRFGSLFQVRPLTNAS